MLELTYNNLKKLSQPKTEQLTSAEYGGMKSALARNLPYYGKLKDVFPHHWISFHGMQKRSKSNDKCKISSRYSFDVDGFINFIMDTGYVPEGMNSPTIGRKNHDIGYIENNFQWESKSDNCKESANRNIDIFMNNISVLTEDIVKNIRHLYKEKNYSIYRIWKEYYPQFGRTTIRSAVIGKTWNHID